MEEVTSCLTQNRIILIGQYSSYLSTPLIQRSSFFPQIAVDIIDTGNATKFTGK